MKASDLAVWVNDALGLVQEDFYSTRTMITWLHKCGFKVKKDISTSKGCGCALDSQQGTRSPIELFWTVNISKGQGHLLSCSGQSTLTREKVTY